MIHLWIPPCISHNLLFQIHQHLCSFCIWAWVSASYIIPSTRRGASFAWQLAPPWSFSLVVSWTCVEPQTVGKHFHSQYRPRSQPDYRTRPYWLGARLTCIGACRWGSSKRCKGSTWASSSVSWPSVGRARRPGWTQLAQSWSGRSIRRCCTCCECKSPNSTSPGARTVPKGSQDQWRPVQCRSPAPACSGLGCSIRWSPSQGSGLAWCSSSTPFGCRPLSTTSRNSFEEFIFVRQWQCPVSRNGPFHRYPMQRRGIRQPDLLFRLHSWSRGPARPRIRSTISTTFQRRLASEAASTLRS